MTQPVCSGPKLHVATHDFFCRSNVTKCGILTQVASPPLPHPNLPRAALPHMYMEPSFNTAALLSSPPAQNTTCHHKKTRKNQNQNLDESHDYVHTTMSMTIRRMKQNETERNRTKQNETERNWITLRFPMFKALTNKGLVLKCGTSLPARRFNKESMPSPN